MGDIVAGQVVGGRYRIVRRLGAGGMGTVYVAVQEPLERQVALKVIRRDLSGDEKTIERFRREATTLAQAHHPHIVTLLDFGELDDGALFFAMELVPGESLRQRLNRTGPLMPKKTMTLVRDIASALACAHGLGIIHRDLKPDNVLLMEAAGDPDFAKIVDFGVAKLVNAEDADEQQALTQRGSVVGTPGYIAPEVALRGSSSDVRTDLYALGVLWFECLAGRPPYRAATATALLMAHAMDPVPSLPNQIPIPLAGLVQRLLAKSPEDRPESAEELRLLIDNLPPFESAEGVQRPFLTDLVARPDVDADAATLNDVPRVSPKAGVKLPFVDPDAKTGVPSPSKPPSKVPFVDPSSAETGTPAKLKHADILGVPARFPTEMAPPTELQTSPPVHRQSLIAPAALLGLAIIVAVGVGALLLRPSHNAGVVDAGTTATTTTTTTTPTTLPLEPLRDAGVARGQDAGTKPVHTPVQTPVQTPVHTPHTPHTPANPQNPEHKPDIYD